MPVVILPVLDEIAALPWVLSRMPLDYEPLVVDNGSTDGSAECASRLGARVIVEPQRGFGAACWAGLMAAPEEIICFMDCDGSLDPQDLPVVAEPVIEKSADLVLGRRVAEKGGVAPTRPVGQSRPVFRSASSDRPFAARPWSNAGLHKVPADGSRLNGSSFGMAAGDGARRPEGGSGHH